MKFLVKLLLHLILPFIITMIAFSYSLWLGLLSILAYILVELYLAQVTLFTVIAGNNYAKGKFENAAKWYGKAANSNKAKASNKNVYGFILLREGKIDEAEKIFNGIIKAYDTSEDDLMTARINMSIVLWKRDNLDEAIELLEEILKKVKTSNVYGNLGLFLILKGDLEKALALNLEAYDYNNTHKIIVYNIAYNYLLLEQLDKAKEFYDKLFELNPTFPEAFYDYGILLCKLGEKEKALEYFKNAAKCNVTFMTTVTHDEIESKIKELEQL